MRVIKGMCYPRSVLRCNSGLALIEFAFTLPLLILLLFGSIEVARYIIITQRVDRATYAFGEVVTENHLTNSLAGAYMSNLLGAMSVILYPYATSTNYVEFISDVSYSVTAGHPMVSWQCTGGGLAEPSKIGSTGGVANLSSIPGNFILGAGDEVVITETYFQFAPITNIVSFLVNLPPLYRVAVFVPRGESLADSFLPSPPCTGGAP